MTDPCELKILTSWARPSYQRWRLHEMQEDEESHGGQRPDVDLVQAGGVAQIAFLCVPNQPPDRDLVGQVKTPGRGSRDEGWLRQLPIIPGHALIRQQRNAVQPLAGQPDDSSEDEAKRDPSPQDHQILAAGLGCLGLPNGLCCDGHRFSPGQCFDRFSTVGSCHVRRQSVEKMQRSFPVAVNCSTKVRTYRIHAETPHPAGRYSQTNDMVCHE